MKVLIVGANGFIGSILFNSLKKSSKFYVTGLCRSHSNTRSSLGDDGLKYVDYQKLSNRDFRDFDIVINVAGLAHTNLPSGPASERLYKSVNVDLTASIAKMSAKAGVKRFIYLSSVKVNGSHTSINSPFTQSSPPNPLSDYARSKYEAELRLWDIEKKSKMEIVIIRPPLVYGPGVKANLYLLQKLVKVPFIVPLGGLLSNKRSMVSVVNLIDFIKCCMVHPNAANHTLLISDDDDVSTSKLVSLLKDSLGGRALIVKVPEAVIRKLLIFFGLKRMVNPLLSSMQVDISFSKELLGWTPPLKLKDALIGMKI